MPNLKQDVKRMQELTFEAFKASGGVLALIDDKQVDQQRLSRKLEEVAGFMERGAVELRCLCETHQPRLEHTGGRHSGQDLQPAGDIESNGYGWLHITINALLPNCRYQSPIWLKDTLARLLDQYEQRTGTLPKFDQALIVIDEHCDIDNRQVFDQDNKSWKAIPNALKGRVIPDDDQFTAGVCLISTRSKECSCHIYLMPQRDAGDFFFLRSDQYPFQGY